MIRAIVYIAAVFLALRINFMFGAYDQRLHDRASLAAAHAETAQAQAAAAREHALGMRLFRCGALMDAITFAQQTRAPLSGEERWCWREWNRMPTK